MTGPRWVAPVALAAIIASVGWRAHTWTAPLQWPHDLDVFRDIASAETMRQGHWLADAFYAGETIWYNPLTPALVAVLSLSTDVPVHRLYAASGWVIGLAVPASLALLLASTLGMRAALAAVTLFLFLPPARLDGWAWASYSPWLFPTVFAQAPFFIGLWVFDRAQDRQSWPWWILTGVLLGLTFLTHTAPALILGGVLVIGAIDQALRPGARPRAHAAVRLVGALIVALAVSWPLLFSIAAHYQFTVRNPLPGSWGNDAFLAMVFSPDARLATLGALPLAASGVAWILRTPERRARSRVLMAWTVSSSLWLAWALTYPLRRQLGIPGDGFVPNYHFLTHWRALLAVLAGLGIVALAEAAARVLATRRTANPQARELVRRRVMHAATALTITTVVAVGHARLNERRDFGEAVTVAMARTDAERDGGTIAWIQTATPESAVFLTYDDLAQYVVAPAGRKVLAVGSFFSNPYVDRERRINMRGVLWNALMAGDRDTFCRIAAPYGIEYAALITEHSRDWAPAMRHFMTLVHEADGAKIWHATGCTP